LLAGIRPKAMAGEFPIENVKNDENKKALGKINH
jgi:hypothetical protein